MKKNIILIIVFGLLFLSLLMPLTSAYFTKSHLYWVIKGMNEVDSPITQQCKPYLAEVLDGNTGADVFVIHYTDKNVLSYVSTHTRAAGFQACLDQAGSDIKARCRCIGDGTHIVEDRWSHLQGGVVYKYLQNSFAPNLGGHMAIEKNFENKHMTLLENNNDPYLDELEYYNDRVLDTYFDETGGDTKALDLLATASGLSRESVENDAKIFRSGYLGEGFYQTVYKNKVNLPNWLIIIPSVLMILGLFIPIICLWRGQTNWKWVLAGIWFILFLLGLLVFISFLTGTTWKITTMFIEIPPTFGYLSVSQQDIQYYNQQGYEATANFLKTGNLGLDDASGLTYYDRNGKKVDGALSEAETRFKYLFYLVILPIIVILNFILFIKTFRRKK